MFKKIGTLLVAGLVLFGVGCKKSDNANDAQSEAARLQAQKNIEFEKTMQSLTVNDRDFDGLSNDEETNLGSNPDDPDTDSDGVTDYDEVKNYKTNILKADTDGDGKSDGYEIRRGLDPLR